MFVVGVVVVVVFFVQQLWLYRLLWSSSSCGHCYCFRCSADVVVVIVDGCCWRCCRGYCGCFCRSAAVVVLVVGCCDCYLLLLCLMFWC